METPIPSPRAALLEESGTPPAGKGPRRRLWIAAALSVLAVGVGAVGYLTGASNSPTVLAAADTSGQATTGAADQSVCSDLDARGGTFYREYVVKIMGQGQPGYKTVNVDPDVMQRGINALTAVGATAPRASSGGGTAASPALETDRASMVNSASSMSNIYANMDATSLLTAFVATSVECSKLGHSPSWFNPQALSGNSSSPSTANPAQAPAYAPPALATTAAAAPAGPATVFTGGTYEVGDEAGSIPPGTYKATCATNGYWARLRSTSGSSDIIDNDWNPNGGPMIVTVKKSDAAVELGDCTWTRSR
ncbi:hypothetical protein [Actinomycetospora atypica]|uniref:Uncharacterized protein n=1 Tax=Actinomycetospora atypica TaxID=1290095 RepID=A0ABV9YKR2_9PSEU